MNTIGIDIGSTFLKAAVFSLDEGRILARQVLPAPPRLFSPDPLVFELDARLIAAAVRRLAEDAAARFSLDGLLLSTQMHGFVYRAQKRGPDRYVSWQDSRSTKPLGGRESALSRFSRLLTDREWEATGVRPKPSLGVCNLYALLHGEDAPPADGELFTLGSYLIAELTGNNVCHITNAAPLGLVDLPGRRWCAPVMERAGLERVRLPRLAENDCQVCGLAEIGGQRIPVFPDYGDQQVSILGSGATGREAVVNIATASQVSRNTGTFAPGPYEIRPYFEGTYLNTISNMPGGRNLAVLIRFLAGSASAVCGGRITEQTVWKAVRQRVERARKREDPAAGLRVDTLFYPTADRLEGGSIAGIRPDNLELGALFCAAYRDMARVYAAHVPLLSGGALPEGLVFSGGASWKNPDLIAAAAAEMGLPYRLSALPNEALGGLYRLSLAACGLSSGPCDPDVRPLTED